MVITNTKLPYFDITSTTVPMHNYYHGFEKVPHPYKVPSSTVEHIQNQLCDRVCTLINIYQFQYC